MPQEISAGGIIVYFSGKGWEVLLIKDMNDVWTFPKGLIKNNEKPVSAARREIAEEVGLTKLNLVYSLKPIKYYYRREGLIHKKVHYFLFKSLTRQKPICQTEENIKEAQWINLDKALSLVGYPKSSIPLLQEVQKKIDLWKLKPPPTSNV